VTEPVFSMTYVRLCQSRVPRTRRWWRLSAVWPLVLASAIYGQDPSPPTADPAINPEFQSDLFGRVIANQKKMELTLDEYERTEKVEVRKTGSDPKPSEVRVWRLFPAGPAITKLPISLDGTPVNSELYREDLEKLEKYLVWAAQGGPAQQEAYAKAQRKRKERHDLIATTHDAFLFSRVGEEKRGEQTLTKYAMVPNPKYKATTRNAIIFSKVRGTVWIDEQSRELARIEGTVTEDIAISLFLAKVYKGSHFMQERYEMTPGHWFPSYEQYDFDGRKFVVSFSIHERTFYSDYKRVGPPKEAVEAVRNELNKLESNPTAK
jgi:hypothetical protein